MGADRKGPLAAFVVVAIVAAVLLITSVRSQAAPGFLDPSIPSTVLAAPRAATGLWRSIHEDAHQVVAQGMVLARKAGVADPSDDSVTTASPATPLVVAPPVTIAAAQPHPATAGRGPKGADPATHGRHGHGPARPPHGGQTTHHGHQGHHGHDAGHRGHDAGHHVDAATAGHAPHDPTSAPTNNGLHLGWTADDHARHAQHVAQHVAQQVAQHAAQQVAQQVAQHYGHAFGHAASSNALKHVTGGTLGRVLKLAKAAGHGQCHGNGFGRGLSHGRGIAFGRGVC